MWPAGTLSAGEKLRFDPVFADRVAGEISMKLHGRNLICLLSLVFVCIAQAQTTAEEAVNDVLEESADSPAIEPEALSVLKGMADYLTSADKFAFHVESAYDVVQESGIKVEFGESRRILLSRPNRLRVESRRRDGMRGVFVFDGNDIWAYEPDENVYATVEQPGDLDEAIDFVVTELRMKAALADLFSMDLYKNVESNLTDALYLGETVVAGVDCDHLLMSNEYADFQMWITSGDRPLLKRIVITYREEPGEPQYRAHIVKWEMSPADTGGQFEFEPPDGAERIRFYVPAPAAEMDEEDEG